MLLDMQQRYHSNRNFNTKFVLFLFAYLSSDLTFVSIATSKGKIMFSVVYICVNYDFYATFYQFHKYHVY